jgi:hypothetical protein
MQKQVEHNLWWFKTHFLLNVKGKKQYKVLGINLDKKGSF